MTKLSIRVAADQDQLDWVEEKIKSGVFASRSHAYRFAIGELMRLEQMRIKSLTTAAKTKA